MSDYLLTTTDNPFDPFTQWDEWYAYDVQKGYNTCSYLARIAKTSPDFSDEDNELAINEAIDEIVEMNINGLYTKVYEKNNQ